MPTGQVDRPRPKAPFPDDLREAAVLFKEGIKKAPGVTLDKLIPVFKECFRQVTLDRLLAQRFAGDIPQPKGRTAYDHDKLWMRTAILRSEGKGPEEIIRIIRREEGISRTALRDVWKLWSTHWDK
jgi:hypothetical protein